MKIIKLAQNRVDNLINLDAINLDFSREVEKLKRYLAALQQDIQSPEESLHNELSKEDIQEVINTVNEDITQNLIRVEFGSIKLSTLEVLAIGLASGRFQLEEIINIDFKENLNYGVKEYITNRIKSEVEEKLPIYLSQLNIIVQ